MTTTKPDKVTKAEKEFKAAYGHYQSECLPGCIRPTKKGDVHRNSLARPGDNYGKPFVETWEERQARKITVANGRNGPVLTMVRGTVQGDRAINEFLSAGTLEFISQCPTCGQSIKVKVTEKT